jgi:hypothetical protein
MATANEGLGTAPAQQGLSRGQKIALLVVAVTLLLLIGGAAAAYWRVRDLFLAEQTVSDMSSLMMLLDSDQPDRVDPASIRAMLAKENRSVWEDDGWGRPLVVLRQIKAGQPAYTVISLGRSGRRGPCCMPRVSSWDDNAVLAGKDWLQVWTRVK